MESRVGALESIDGVELNNNIENKIYAVKALIKFYWDDAAVEFDTNTGILSIGSGTITPKPYATTIDIDSKIEKIVSKKLFYKKVK